MFVTLITDCKSPNDKARQETRLISLFDSPVSFVGINPSFGTNLGALEAGGTLIDTIDAANGQEGIILVNIAPRGHVDKDYNGASFCYFSYKNTLIISTFNEVVFGFVKRFELADKVYIVSIPEVLQIMKDNYEFDDSRVEMITNSQFRSYDFVPFLAHALWSKTELPNKPYKIQDTTSGENAIWYIDNFGNCKSTILFADLKANIGDPVNTTIGQIKLYGRLKDVPIGDTALYIGSSGLAKQRFIELAVQQSSAERVYGLSVGSRLVI